MFFIISFNGFYILKEESNFVNCSSFLKRVERIFEFEMIILCFSVTMKRCGKREQSFNQKMIVHRWNLICGEQKFRSFSYADVFIGAPLFMDRGSDGKLQEVGQVSVSLQRASGDFQTTRLNGFEVFARFGSAIAPLGDLDQDGFNGKIRVQHLWVPDYLYPPGEVLYPYEQTTFLERRILGTVSDTLG